MEMLTLMQMLLAFFQPDAQTPKLPQAAPAVQCRQWLDKQQTLWAQAMLCGRQPEIPNLRHPYAPVVVLQANRCDETLTRDEAGQAARRHPAYALLEQKTDRQKTPDAAKVKAYCAGIDDAAFRRLEKEFSDELIKIDRHAKQEP